MVLYAGVTKLPYNLNENENTEIVDQLWRYRGATTPPSGVPIWLLIYGPFRQNHLFRRIALNSIEYPSDVFFWQQIYMEIIGERPQF